MLATELQLALLVADGIIYKVLTIEGLAQHLLADVSSLLGKWLVAIEARDDIEHLGIEHIRRIAHILHQLVRLRVLYKDPLWQPLQQSILVEIWAKELYQFIHSHTSACDSLGIACAVEILLQLEHKPHCPIGDVVVVAVVGRVTHRKHSLVDILELLG